jgi:rhodanese-related sulfurtransferase
MSAPTAATISATELRDLLNTSTPSRVVDVRTPGEFETAHITGSYNVPLDVLDQHAAGVVESLASADDVVLVCRSGQRAEKAYRLLQEEGLATGRVLQHGFLDWENHGFAVEEGVKRWDLERQVRLVAGGLVLSSVLSSVALPRLKWLAAAIGGGLTYAAISNTCAMATALSKLPYNRGSTTDPEKLLSVLAVSRHPK